MKVSIKLMSVSMGMHTKSRVGISISVLPGPVKSVTEMAES